MNRSFFGLRQSNFLVLLFILEFVYSKECEPYNQCKGPIRHYEDLKCKPIYEKPGDCCAVRYDCLHLNNRSLDKCYAYGREYTSGERVIFKDGNTPVYVDPCTDHCQCSTNPQGSRFICLTASCVPIIKTPNSNDEMNKCYLWREPDKCCSEKKVCPENEADIFKCKVDGKNYTYGQSFYPKNDPHLVCFCLKGYKGENVPPYCKKLSCNAEMFYSTDLYHKCAPVFDKTDNPQTNCAYDYKCQSEADAVMRSKSNGSENHKLKEVPEEMMCKFGNLKMHIGDELNQHDEYLSKDVKCICELPPTPTCQYLEE